MAYIETVGLIVSLFCLPLLGFLLGKRFTVARLTGERDRQAELQDIHTLIDNNRNDVAEQVRSIYDQINQHADNNSRDVAEQVRSIYDEIKQHQDENSQALQGVSSDVWTKLQEVDKELGLASSTRPTQPVYQPQTTTTA